MNDDKKPPSGRPPRRDPYRLTGELFGGRYRLEEFAGMGSFGAVYRATDTRVGRTVAVKILKPDLGDDEMNDARELFQREALTAGRLMHPHIVAVTDVGEEAGFAYLVMEWLEGTTLEDELRARVPFSPEETSSLLGTISDALTAAHNAGVIHRDIKPSNIHLGRRERPFVKVLDFGIAKVVTSSTAVAASRIAGTVSYMSPEQITGSRIDRRTDIYSLGVVLYQMLTGELPFKGDSQGHIIQQHIATTPPLLSEARPDLPPELSHVIQRALGKLPEARQQSAQELHTEFAAALTRKAAQTTRPKVNPHEEVTEVLPPQVPPTVLARQGVEPQSTMTVGQRPAALLTDQARNEQHAHAPSWADTGPGPEFPTRPLRPAGRMPAMTFLFPLAGAVIAFLFSFVAGRVFASSWDFTGRGAFKFAQLTAAFFGLLLGVVASSVEWSRRLVYYALGGAGAFFLLSLLAPNLINLEHERLITDSFRHLFVHNMLIGAVVGVTIYSLRPPVVPARWLRSFVSHGAAGILILMFLYYLHFANELYQYTNSRVEIVYFLREHVNTWVAYGLGGFITGMLVFVVRLTHANDKRSMR
jgi:serine/threonine protein kinase